MKHISYRPRSRYDKLKTLCTLDTSDVLITSDIKQIIDRGKYHPFTTKSKINLKKQNRHSISLTQYRPQKHITLSNEKGHNQNHLMKTINTECSTNKRRQKSRQRIKTQCLVKSPNKVLLQNLEMFSNLKNINFHMDLKYNVDPFYLINTVKSGKEQTIQTVKKLDKNHRSAFYTLKKSNSPKFIEKYEREIRIKQELTDHLKANERKNLSCIHKVYKKDNEDNTLVLYELQGEPLSWKKDLSKRLIHNLPKNDMQILKHLIVELSKAIHILSSYGFYHSEIRLKSVLVELRQDEENVKVSKLVKLGNLGSCYKIKDKKSFTFMSHSIYTPPQILNFIMFQNQSKNFNRSWLEYIYKYEDAWKIGVWSLGILILELFNQKSLQKQYFCLEEIIEFQKYISLKCGFLFEKIGNSEFQGLLKKMVSVDPEERPSPQQIILLLTS